MHPDAWQHPWTGTTWNDFGPPCVSQLGCGFTFTYVSICTTFRGGLVEIFEWVNQQGLLTSDQGFSWWEMVLAVGEDIHILHFGGRLDILSHMKFWQSVKYWRGLWINLPTAVDCADDIWNVSLVARTILNSTCPERDIYPAYFSMLEMKPWEQPMYLDISTIDRLACDKIFRFWWYDRHRCTNVAFARIVDGQREHRYLSGLEKYNIFGFRVLAGH